MTFVPSFIDEWYRRLEPGSLSVVVPSPRFSVLISVDMVVGFCQAGALASERVGRLVPSVVRLFEQAYRHGMWHFVLLQDAHEPCTPEFQAYPPHCLRDSREAETIGAIAQLPFANEFVVIQKNSLSPSVDTRFDLWLHQHPQVQTAIVVGDCTDLCVQQVAMYLRVRANAMNLDGFRVIVPANAVDTYDIPEQTAKERGAFVHPGDFFHQVFLYHLALNGVEVCRELK